MLSEGGFTHDWLHFKSDLLERQSRFHRILSVPVDTETREIWKEFLENAAARDSFKNLFLAHLNLRKILLPFLLQNNDWKSSRKNEPFEKVLSYIKTHYQESLFTPQLAELMNMDRNTFSLAFRKEFGVTPREYLTNTRIAKAKELLLGTS